MKCWQLPCGHTRDFHTWREIDDCFKYGLNIGGPYECPLDVT